MGQWQLKVFWFWFWFLDTFSLLHYKWYKHVQVWLFFFLLFFFSSSQRRSQFLIKKKFLSSALLYRHLVVNSIFLKHKFLLITQKEQTTEGLLLYEGAGTSCFSVRAPSLVSLVQDCGSSRPTALPCFFWAPTQPHRSSHWCTSPVWLH